MTDSHNLLAAYVLTGSEDAFGELVARYVDLVYSTALRLVGGDTHRAEDVAQTVFCDLARLSQKLPDDVMLGGWLHRNTCFVAAKTMRSERRRQSRERQAVEMNTLQDSSEANFSHLAPILDEAINQLGEADRAAILLRFFERHDFRSVGQALGSNEDAARMRVSRALEKLESLLKHRGVTTSATALSAVLLANAVQAAPAGLAVTISTAAALAGAAVHTSTVIAATKTIAMTTLQKALIGATLAVAMGAGLYEARRISTLQTQLQALHQHQGPLAELAAQLARDNQGLSNQLARAQESLATSAAQFRELLKLRGEVATLRRQQHALERVAGSAAANGAESLNSSSSDVAPQVNPALPFQVQLVMDESGDNTEPMTNNFNGAIGETLHLQKTPLLGSSAVGSATVSRNPLSGLPEIDVEFSPEGKNLFADITKANINKRLAFVLDGHLYSAPVIRSEISGGKAQINGSFTEEEANALAAKINAAANRP